MGLSVVVISDGVVVAVSLDDYYGSMTWVEVGLIEIEVASWA